MLPPATHNFISFEFLSYSKSTIFYHLILKIINPIKKVGTFNKDKNFKKNI